MRFLGRPSWREEAPYVLHPPYGEARSRLLARLPAPGDDGTTSAFGLLFVVVADIGLADSLVSVYLFADGTISIYGTNGIQSTGLRGAPNVAAVATEMLETVGKTLGEFSPVDDLGALPLPARGHAQILVRTPEGDLAAFDRPNPKHGPVAGLSAMALTLIRLARMALVEGFDRVEAGDVLYRVSVEYRRIRSALLNWLPAPERLPADARVAGVAMEVGDPYTDTVTSLFAFADGSTSLYRSDGTLVEGLSEVPGMAEATRALLAAIEIALPAFEPADLIALPQPGRVQFMARARPERDGEWTQLVAIASRAALANDSHPLSAAFARAHEVLRIAG